MQIIDRTQAPNFKVPDELSFPEVETTLVNNTNVKCMRSSGPPVVRLEFVFSSGVYYEDVPGQSYFAAKMLLGGTSKLSASEISSLLEFHGIQLDVSTGLDLTTLTVYCLDKKVFEALEILKTLLFDSAFPNEEFQHQKQLKQQEVIVNLEKTSFLASREIRVNLFGNHPYGKSISVQDIENLSLDSIVGFARTKLLSSPNVFVSGSYSDSSFDAVKSFVDMFERGEAQAEVRFANGSMPETKKITKKGAVQASIRLAMPVIPMTHTDYSTLVVCNELFGGFFGSRLMKNIREEKGYTYGISSSMAHPLHASFMIIGTDVAIEYVDSTLGEIKLEMTKLQNEMVADSELNLVKNHMIGSMQSSLNTPFGLMDRYKSVYFAKLDEQFYRDYPLKIREVSSKDVLSVAQKYLQYGSFDSVVVGDFGSL